ncbi:hypothetical protein Tco_1381251, partial [Tanacetum coccineum]
MINLHTIRDDSLLDVKDSKAYKTYYDFAIGKATPKKARKFKKIASPLRKLSPILEEEHAEKPKQAKKSAKKSTTVPTIGVAIIDTPRKSVLKKKTLAKVLDESEDKTTGTDEGTSTKPGVLDVPKYLSESENESWGDSGDDGRNDDDSNEVTKDDDEDDVESDANDDKEANDSEKTDSDEDENLNLNLNQNDD